MNKIPFYMREPNGAWQRRQKIWERHQAGETYTAMAREMGITPARVRELAEHWARRCRLIERYGGGWTGG